MTQPRPAPVKPQPIRDDPHAGHYSIVISFRVPPYDGASVEATRARLRRRLPDILGYRTPPLEALDVAVRVHGAGGEAFEHEGTVGL